MTKLAVNPTRIAGVWDDGYALDQHVKSSEFLGYDGAGHPMFDTVRTELGEALYRLKYQDDQSQVADIAETAAGFVQHWKVRVDVIIPMPPSKARVVQPVHAIGRAISKRLAIGSLEAAIKRTKELPAMKNVDVAARQELLAGAFEVDPVQLKNRNVLLLDDLFQSGATMNAVAGILKSIGGAAKVFALALTRTKR